MGDLETLYFQSFINGLHTPDVRSAHFLLNLKTGSSQNVAFSKKRESIFDPIHNSLERNATVHIPNNGIAFLIQCLISDESQTAYIVMVKYSIVLN